MAFKRALWSSGYTYKMRCPACGTVNEYTDKALDFRAWYPNGFVYCATCRKPLRHNEIFAVDKDGNPVFKSQAEADASVDIGYMKSMGYPAGVQAAHTAANAAGPTAAASPAAAAPVAAAPVAAASVTAAAAPVPEPVETAPLEAAPVETAAAPAASAEEEPKAETRFCTKCGRKYKKGIDHFCSGCGNKLEDN